MSRFPRIESRQNPRVKTLVKLRAARARAQSGRFLVEGELELDRALRAGVPVRELYVCPEHWRDASVAMNIATNAEKARAKVFECTPEVFAKITLRDGPDGLLGIAESRPRPLADLDLPAEPLLVVAEGVEKPGNLGALIRTAEAAGAHALIAANAVADFDSPQVVRNSRGLVFTLPCMTATNEEIVAVLRKRGIRAVATTPAGDTAHWDAELGGGLAVLVGSEHDGLSDFWLEHADLTTRIPMIGAADSLNVNTATAVVLFEALRQRQRQR